MCDAMATVKGQSGAKPSRREKAQATRSRMIAAAHLVFVERGYGGSRMADIADAAGVAVQTLYFTFHTKAELLQACYDRAVLGDADPLPPQEQPFYVALLKAKSARTALRHFVIGNTAIATRVALLDEVVRAAAHQPEALAVREHSEHLRRLGYGQVVTHLAKTFGLRKGLGIERATDLLLLYGGAAVYRTLVVDYEWPEARFVDWLTETLTNELIG